MVWAAARAAALALLALGVVACKKQDPARTGGSPRVSAAPAPKEVRVIEVKTTEDLTRLRTEYLTLLGRGFKGLIEVRFAPGDYTPVDWSMAPDGKAAPPAIDLVLKGSATLPGFSRLSGRSVRLEGLVLTSQRSSAMQIEVSAEVEVVRCALVDGRLTDPNLASPYLELRARGSAERKQPVQALVEASWFVRNFQQGGAPCQLLAFVPDDREPGYFERAVVRDSVFIGNAFSSEVHFQLAQDARIERTIFHKTWASGSLVSAGATAAVTVQDSVLSAESLEHLARVDATPALRLAGTHIHVAAGADGALPASLTSDTPARDRSGITAALQQLTDAVKAPTGLPPADLQPQLLRALRR